VVSFFSVHATYYLNGHSLMEQELKRNNIGFRRATMPSWRWTMSRRRKPPADRLGPQIIRRQLDYWTLILGPNFSKKERSQMSLSRFYSIMQIECGIPDVSTLLTQGSEDQGKGEGRVFRSAVHLSSIVRSGCWLIVSISAWSS
jgi:hypothetical protein